MWQPPCKQHRDQFYDELYQSVKFAILSIVATENKCFVTSFKVFLMARNNPGTTVSSGCFAAVGTARRSFTNIAPPVRTAATCHADTLLCFVFGALVSFCCFNCQKCLAAFVTHSVGGSETFIHQQSLMKKYAKFDELIQR